MMEMRQIGEGTNGWCGVDELCGGDELKVYVCLLFRRQVVVGGSRGDGPWVIWLWGPWSWSGADYTIRPPSGT